MCGRYNVTDDPAVHALLDALNIDLGPLPVRYNIAPTDSVPVIHYWEGERIISDMRWWLVPHWSPGPSTKFSMFNARSEKLSTSRAYQGSFRHKRAVLPAASFVEWHRHQGEKTPYLFEGCDQALAFAGLWDYWTDGTEHVLSCSIVTTEASPEFAPYHHRMPVLLNTERAEQWLDQRATEQSLTPLFQPALPYDLQATPIDRRYNNSRDKGEPVRLEKPIKLAQ
ncbi:MAG: SOS response-associated peptidase [Gammaproteobacteria bacterium]